LKIVYEMQSGFVETVPDIVIVKLVPAVLALTVGCNMAVLHVTLRRAPSEASKVSWIWELAVTLVVLTVNVAPPAGTATLPDAAAAQTAGEAAFAQLEPV
jgi:hypothetical protein